MGPSGIATSLSTARNVSAGRAGSIGLLLDYPQEQFSSEERRLLEPHFTNLDKPVFCIVDLPEVVKGALFARYSRYQGTLRRLYLDEFVEGADRLNIGRTGSGRDERGEG